MMYRTGDLGRYDPYTGCVECLGRLDRQIKVGGVRIEPGEIEQAAIFVFSDQLRDVTVLSMEGALVGVMVAKDGRSTLR